jgi:hypothetical protein
MLQVAEHFSTRKVLIITYNRALADECTVRIQNLGMENRVHCYTIHSLAGKFAGAGVVCNDDQTLLRLVDNLDAKLTHPQGFKIPLDLVMLDEAQDLRPLFYRILTHIFFGAVRSMQLCLVGDPKQMLYDFDTYGDDKASTQYLLFPEKYWARFTSNRMWKHLSLSVSYRLTPNIASFCNLFWGTSIVGGNTSSPNIPVEYFIKYPYPPEYPTVKDVNKLSTLVLSGIIDQHGPENVLFLSQSIKENSPLRIHVNKLTQIKEKGTGQQKYNFHIKESHRGFEGKPDLKNKVRVWTFCGSKGCEADVVVVFGFDLRYGQPHGLNQIGVALSRAKKRLVVVQGQAYHNVWVPLPYYPILGDSQSGVEQHIVRFGENNAEEQMLNIAELPSDDGGSDSSNVYSKRSEWTRGALEKFFHSGVITLSYGSHDISSLSSMMMPQTALAPKKDRFETCYFASGFTYFSALSENKFLQYGKWECCNEEQKEIFYKNDVKFATTTEDVSALYGEALTYMLQWELIKYVPNIETVVSDGILRLDPKVRYSHDQIHKSLRDMKCMKLSAKDGEALDREFSLGRATIKGQDLVPFLNNRLSIKKIRVSRYKGAEQQIVFPVKVMEKKPDDDDKQLNDCLPHIRAVYKSEKKPSQWVYLGALSIESNMRLDE